MGFLTSYSVQNPTNYDKETLNFVVAKGIKKTIKI
jgi:hypothetical protein